MKKRWNTSKKIIMDFKTGLPKKGKKEMAKFTDGEMKNLTTALTAVYTCCDWLFTEYIGSGEVNSSGCRDHFYRDLQIHFDNFIHNVNEELNRFGLGVLHSSYKDGCKIVSVDDEKYITQMVEETRLDLLSRAGQAQLALMKANGELKDFEVKHPLNNSQSM